MPKSSSHILSKVRLSRHERRRKEQEEKQRRKQQQEEEQQQKEQERLVPPTPKPHPHNHHQHISRRILLIVFLFVFALLNLLLLFGEETTTPEIEFDDDETTTTLSFKSFTAQVFRGSNDNNPTLVNKTSTEDTIPKPRIYTFYHEEYDTPSSLTLWKTAWAEGGFQPIILTLEEARHHVAYDHLLTYMRKVKPDVKMKIRYLRYMAMATVEHGGWLAELHVFPVITEEEEERVTKEVFLELPDDGMFTIHDEYIPSLVSANQDEWGRILDELIQSNEKKSDANFFYAWHQTDPESFRTKKHVMSALELYNVEERDDWCTTEKGIYAMRFSKMDLPSSSPNGSTGLESSDFDAILKQFLGLYKAKCKSDRPIMFTFYEPAGDRAQIRSSTEMISIWKDMWYTAGWQPFVLNLNDAMRSPHFSNLKTLLYHHSHRRGASKEEDTLYDFYRYLAVTASGGNWWAHYNAIPTNMPPSFTLPFDGIFTTYHGTTPALFSGTRPEWNRISVLLMQSLQNHVKDEKIWRDASALGDIHMQLGKDAYVSREEVPQMQNFYPEQVNEGKKLENPYDMDDKCDITKGTRSIQITMEDILKIGYCLEDMPLFTKQWFTAWRDACWEEAGVEYLHRIYPIQEDKPTMHTFFNEIYDPYPTLKMWADKWTSSGWNIHILTIDDAKTHPEYNPLLEILEAVESMDLFLKLRYLRLLAMATVPEGGWLSEPHVLPLNPDFGSQQLPNEGQFTSHDYHVPSLFSASAGEWNRMAQTIIQHKEKTSDLKTLIALHQSDPDAYHYERNIALAPQLFTLEFFYNEWCDLVKDKLALRFGPFDAPKSDIEGEYDTVQMALHWLHLHKSKCLSEKQVIYTFFDPSLSYGNEPETLRAWQDIWTEAGWQPFVLNLNDARRHPKYDFIQSQLRKSSLLQEAETARYIRWVAIAAAGGGWLSDHDVLPLYNLPEMEIPNGGIFTSYQGSIPSLFSGSAAEWDRMAKLIMESSLSHTKTKWTEDLALQEIYDGLGWCLFREGCVPLNSFYLDKKNQTEGLYTINQGMCDATNDVLAVHVSYKDIMRLDFSKKDKRNPQDIMRKWFKAWRETCPEYEKDNEEEPEAILE